MPTFVALVYEPHDTPRDPSSPRFAEYMGGYVAFGEHAGPAITGGAALLGPETATTVSVRGGETSAGADGELVLTDGPFAETKEMLGGFYVLECDDLDSAIELARRIPSAWRDGGHVEVRPAMPM